VIIDALRLMPGGPGQGDGPPPEEVRNVAAALLELHKLSGDGRPVLDWLTSPLGGFSGAQDGDPTLAALAIRDLLAGALPDADSAPPDGADVADAELAAAKRFATAEGEPDS
jgi:hypothetical protein